MLSFFIFLPFLDHSTFSSSSSLSPHWSSLPRFHQTTSLQGLCPCVLEEKKHNNLNHSRRVLWLLRPTDTTQLAAFFRWMSPNKLCQVQKGRSPWKKYISTKTCPSRDNNHINNSPRGSRICQKPAEKNEKFKKTHILLCPIWLQVIKPRLQVNLNHVKYILNLIPKSNWNKWNACGLVWTETGRYLLKNREKDRNE